jgi:hypothetical protein
MLCGPPYRFFWVEYLSLFLDYGPSDLWEDIYGDKGSKEFPCIEEAMQYREEKERSGNWAGNVVWVKSTSDCVKDAYDWDWV